MKQMTIQEASFASLCIEAYNKLHKSTEEFKQEYDDLASELDGLNSELKTIKDRIAELQKLSDEGKITLVEQEELNRLLETNAQLERQIRLREEAAKEAAAKSNKSLIKDYSKEYYNSNVGRYMLADADAIRQQNAEGFKALEEWQLGWSANWDKFSDEEKERLQNLYSEYQNLMFEGNSRIEYSGMIGFDDYVAELIERYKTLEDLGADVTDSQISEMETIRSELVSLSQTLQDKYIDNFVGDGEAVDSWNALADAIDACINPAQHFTSLLNSMSQDLQDVLNAEGSKGELTGDRITELAEQYEELAKWMEDSGYTAEEVASHYNALNIEAENGSEAIGNYTAQISDLTDVLSELQDSYDAVKAAQEDMATGGSLTPKTIDELAKVNSNYLDYLYEENGAIKLNTEAWLENANAKMKGEMVDLQKEIDSLQKQNDLLKESLHYLEYEAPSPDLTAIENLKKQIEENDKTIAKSQNKLNVWKAAFNDVSKSVNELNATLTRLSTASGNINQISNALGDFKENGFATASTLSDLFDTFGNLDSFNDFIKVMGDSSSTMAEAQKACNQLAEEYINSIGILNDLNESNAGVIETMLTEMGVTNAHEVVQGRLNALKLEAILIAKDQADAEWEVAEQLLLETGASESAIASLKRLKQEQYNAKLAATDLSKASADTISSLLTQAQAAGVAAESIAALSRAQSLQKRFEAGTLDEYEANNYGDLMTLYAKQAKADLSNLGGSISVPQVKVLLPKSSSSGSSSKKEVEEYIATIDKYREAVERLNRVQSERENLEANLSNTNDLRTQIELQQELIGVYKKEQDALHELNEQRDQTIKTETESLKKLGFDVEYDPDNNLFFVKNLEHLNDLVASSKGKYDSVKEATNALRQDTEKLINTLGELNTANQENSESWKELAQAAHEARIAIYENTIKEHENSITIGEHWLDDSIKN